VIAAAYLVAGVLFAIGFYLIATGRRRRGAVAESPTTPGAGSTSRANCGERTGRGGKHASLTDWPLSGRALIGRGYRP
jgi:hypothetical protein